jgi:[ribosomal protein S5]-alanine N-acetyltransferase
MEGSFMELKINTLKTERIYLREFQERDWQEVHKYASKKIVCQFQSWGPNSELDSQNFVKQILEDATKEPRTRYAFAIIHIADDNLIGAGEVNIRDITNKQGEIGYSLHPDYWGKGIAAEAARLMIRFGFKQLNFHRIYATCDPRNIGSFKVMEKVGMTQEGRIRENLLLRDGWRDSFLYSILEDEWVK